MFFECVLYVIFEFIVESAILHNADAFTFIAFTIVWFSCSTLDFWLLLLFIFSYEKNYTSLSVALVFVLFICECHSPYSAFYFAIVCAICHLSKKWIVNFMICLYVKFRISLYP